MEHLRQAFDSIHDAGISGYLCVMMAFMAIVVTADRVKALYFSYAINANEFMNSIRSLVQADKIEEAVTHCAGKENIPLVSVIKKILERSDRDDESIAKGQEIALAEVMPLIGKRLGYLSMIANVCTLLGLLGTIQGLILAFAAVAKADPAQKQMILTQGISMAMYMTAFGLMIAIPSMIVYSFLHARQNKHFEEIIENSSKLVDWLSTRHYQPFHMNAVFPNDSTGNGAGKKAPPPPGKLKAV
jgi:biopolymer transport protein ExbB